MKTAGSENVNETITGSYSFLYDNLITFCLKWMQVSSMCHDLYEVPYWHKLCGLDRLHDNPSDQGLDEQFIQTNLISSTSDVPAQTHFFPLFFPPSLAAWWNYWWEWLPHTCLSPPWPWCEAVMLSCTQFESQLLSYEALSVSVWVSSIIESIQVRSINSSSD